MSIPLAQGPGGFGPLQLDADGALITTGGVGGCGGPAENLGWNGSAWIPVLVDGAGRWDLGPVSIAGNRDTSVFQFAGAAGQLGVAAQLYGWDGDAGAWTRCATDDTGRLVVRTLVPASADRNTGAATFAGAAGQLGAAAQAYGFDSAAAAWRRIAVDGAGRLEVAGGGGSGGDVAALSAAMLDTTDAQAVRADLRGAAASGDAVRLAARTVDAATIASGEALLTASQLFGERAGTIRRLGAGASGASASGEGLVVDARIRDASGNVVQSELLGGQRAIYVAPRGSVNTSSASYAGAASTAQIAASVAGWNGSAWQRMGVDTAGNQRMRPALAPAGDPSNMQTAAGAVASVNQSSLLIGLRLLWLEVRVGAARSLLHIVQTGGGAISNGFTPVLRLRPAVSVSGADFTIFRASLSDALAPLGFLITTSNFAFCTSSTFMTVTLEANTTYEWQVVSSVQ